MTKKEKNILRGIEIQTDLKYVAKTLLPDGISLDDFSSTSNPYFKSYGFKVPKYFSQIYEKAGCPSSDKYISSSLYYYYIAPFLYNLNFVRAYLDKNQYYRLFPNIKQPEPVLCNINGKFFSSPPGILQESKILTLEEAVSIIKNIEKFIIKPSIESGGGREVKLIQKKLNSEQIFSLLYSYGSDFIIQKPISQHADLSLLNPTSLNTCRLYTYLPIGQSEYKVLGATVRFGSDGDFRDNACAGGGFCFIHDDGTIDDKICQFKNWTPRSLFKEKYIKNLKFPYFDKIVKKCLALHSNLPHFDLIGWDIAVDKSGNLILIELNHVPDCEHIQLAKGPMFGEYTDELMASISQYETQVTIGMKRTFPNYSQHKTFIFDLKKNDFIL